MDIEFADACIELAMHVYARHNHGHADHCRFMLADRMADRKNQPGLPSIGAIVTPAPRIGLWRPGCGGS